MWRSLLIGMLVLLGSGCGGPGLICESIGLSSVVVHVTDEEGNPLDAKVESSLVEGPQDHCCGGSAHNGYHCEGDLPGDFTIVVEAEGYESVTRMVTVGLTDDGCHVVTETLDIELSPLPTP